jgi:hypothetical protein
VRQTNESKRYANGFGTRAHLVDLLKKPIGMVLWTKEQRDDWRDEKVLPRKTTADAEAQGIPIEGLAAKAGGFGYVVAEAASFGAR